MLPPSTSARSDGILDRLRDLHALQVEVAARVLAAHHDLLRSHARVRHPHVGQHRGRRLQVDVLVARGDDARLGHVPDRAHVRDEHRHLGEAAADLLDRQRRDERVVERVDEDRQAGLAAGGPDRVEQAVVGDVVAVQRRVELQPQDAGTPRERSDLVDGVVGLRHDLAEAVQPVRMRGHEARDEVVLDALRERAHHRHVDACGVHAREQAVDVERPPRRVRVPAREVVGAAADVLRGVVGVDHH